MSTYKFRGAIITGIAPEVSGQVCYFVTIGVAIASICLLLAPSAPGETKAILGSVYYPLASAMACRVYRAVLLGIITERPVNTIEISSAKIQYGSDDEITKSEPDVPANLPIGVAAEMGRQVETPDECFAFVSLPAVAITLSEMRKDSGTNLN
ncbi:hypothetical protein PILCRDRAFT_628507 [Piloderma croceum F 1598]|uniref:Uncharacterized protein n=1 Tax=Piloderma croceum (strain F 1598) TaxID=765440 RepID=A0A0C3FBD0_PILCF|nr:hypothetical protein PILCRDRAFT_628507 [Piloderma croceum F 1598]